MQPIIHLIVGVRTDSMIPCLPMKDYRFVEFLWLNRRATRDRKSVTCEICREEILDEKKAKRKRVAVVDPGQ